MSSNLTAKIFLDENGGPKIARYDQIKYPRIERMLRSQIGFYWVPEEIDLTQDRNDFRRLSESDQHIFTSNLYRQIVLDTEQSKSPSTAFLPLATLPEVEAFIEAWSFFESIHNRSYSHIIRNIYSNPSEVFDKVLDIDEVVDCAESISYYYNELERHNVEWARTGIVTYEHKKAIWRALVAVNALEGLRFYVSFACSWNFAQLKKMMGNANIIRLICRDENVHLMFTQYLLNVLPRDDKDFAKIRDELEGECVSIYQDVVEQEKQWAGYLFKHGSMIGLNERIACQYIEWLCNKRMPAINLRSPYKGKDGATSNPLPWTEQWISSKDVQNANQENENTSYVIGGLKPDSNKVNVEKDFDFERLLQS